MKSNISGTGRNGESGSGIIIIAVMKSGFYIIRNIPAAQESLMMMQLRKLFVSVG